MNSKSLLLTSSLVLMSFLSGCGDSSSVRGASPIERVTVDDDRSLLLNQKMNMHPRVTATCRINNLDYDLELPPSSVLDTVESYISSIIRENGQMWRKLEPAVIGSIYRKCIEPGLIERVARSEAQNEK